MYTGRTGSNSPCNLGNLACGVRLLSRAEQYWALDRAGVNKTVTQVTAAHNCGPNQLLIMQAIRHGRSSCQAKACYTHSAILAHLAGWLRMRSHDLYITHLLKHNASMHQAPPAMRQPLSRREGGLWPLRARTHP